MASNNNSGNNKQSGNQGNNQSGGNNSNRGFASMDPQKQREIASEGGRAAHAAGTAHEFNSQEAREAGHLSHKNDGNRQSGNSGSDNRSSGNNANSGGNNNGGHGNKR